MFWYFLWVIQERRSCRVLYEFVGTPESRIFMKHFNYYIKVKKCFTFSSTTSFMNIIYVSEKVQNNVRRICPILVNSNSQFVWVDPKSILWHCPQLQGPETIEADLLTEPIDASSMIIWLETSFCSVFLKNR